MTQTITGAVTVDGVRYPVQVQVQLPAAVLTANEAATTGGTPPVQLRIVREAS